MAVVQLIKDSVLLVLLIKDSIVIVFPEILWNI